MVVRVSNHIETMISDNVDLLTNRKKHVIHRMNAGQATYEEVVDFLEWFINRMKSDGRCSHNLELVLEDGDTLSLRQTGDKLGQQSYKLPGISTFRLRLGFSLMAIFVLMFVFVFYGKDERKQVEKSFYPKVAKVTEVPKSSSSAEKQTSFSALPHSEVSRKSEKILSRQNSLPSHQTRQVTVTSILPSKTISSTPESSSINKTLRSSTELSNSREEDKTSSSSSISSTSISSSSLDSSNTVVEEVSNETKESLSTSSSDDTTDNSSNSATSEHATIVTP